MNPPLSIEQLRRLEGIMQTMLAEANNANWQELSRLDSERRVLIDYQERSLGKHINAPDKAPAISSARTTPNPEYLALSAELKALDKAITTTVLNARHALLEQTRGLRAQVSAKKGYEQANTMKVNSYS